MFKVSQIHGRFFRIQLVVLNFGGSSLENKEAVGMIRTWQAVSVL